VTKTNRNLVNKLLLTLASLALFATACGGGAGPSSEESSAAIAAASTNEAQLQLSDQVDTTQLLNTANGEITDLSSVVDGDRPVLLWYWAPH